MRFVKLNDLPKEAESGGKIRFVTVATHSERYFPILMDSAKRRGIHIDVLGWGQKWQGFAWRYRLLAEYLRDKCHPSDIVVVMDGFDSVILAEKKEFLDKFLHNGHDIAFSVDNKYDNPVIGYLRYRCFGSKPWEDMLNGGLYMGRANAMLHFCEEMSANSKPEDDDQRLLNLWYRQQQTRNYRPGVDTNQVLFYNQWRGGGVEGLVKDGRFFTFNNDGQLVKPCVVSGPGLTDMNALVRKLGYQVAEVPSNYLHPKNLAIVSQKVAHYSKFFQPEIVLIALLLLFIVYSRQKNQINVK